MNNQTAITAWKALNFKDRLEKIAPVHWDIDLTMICNHRCPGCFYIGLPDDGYDSGLGVYRDMKTGTILDREIALSTIAQIPEVGGKAITFVGGGEPTLHRNIVEIFSAVKKANLKFGLISHFGLTYKQEFFDALYGASWVRVSINAATAKTYSKMQGIKEDEFNRVIKNIKTYAKMGGKIGVSFLVHPDNVNEISQAAELFSGAGAAYIQYKPYITDQKEALWQDIKETVSSELSKANTFASSKFQVLDQFQSRLTMLKEFWNLKPCGKCWVPRFNPKITANGKVYVCCELAYSDRGILGDLNLTDLKDMTTSGSWEKAELGIDTDKCPPCWERDLNRAINDSSFHSMKPPPDTVDSEFI